MTDTFDIVLAIALPIIGLIQALSTWHDYKLGRARLSPMHFFERSSSPKAFALTLTVNLILLLFVFLIGFYYAAKVLA